jgi:hypothetical protein
MIKFLFKTKAGNKRVFTSVFYHQTVRYVISMDETKRISKEYHIKNSTEEITRW